MKIAKTTLLTLAMMAVGGLVNAQELTGTLKNIKDTGTITVGYRESSVPFSYLDDSQKPIGFAMDICAKIVEAVKTELKMPNLKVNLTPVTSATRIPLIANGTVDLECGSTTNNLERQKQVAFTNTHYLSATRFASKVSSKIKTLEDMKGKTVVSTSGTVNIKQLNELNTAKGLNINIVAAKDHAEAFLMVETDRAVAFVMDDILLAGFIAGAKEPALYELSDASLSKPDPYGIMLRRDDAAFKALADKATAALYTSPAMIPLYNKWFLTAIPPKGLNMKVKLSAPLKKTFESPTDSADSEAY